ncbi:Fanconi anemia group M protein-like [Apostichopus japonicus]|uniref:Fanconi anemia group M protein-like n=1 Tax=Stichopus japonicus TaxID=307972 RepID=UPI003AB133E1
MSMRSSQSQQKNQTTLLQNWGYYGNQTKKTGNSEELIVIDDDLDAEDEEAFLAACEAAEGQLSSSAALVTDGNQFQQPDCTSVPEASPLESLPGFDVSAGKLWIYPTNYPVRDYQFNIVSQALKKNTLVTLPTGLGKTFIAAVVMFNFYRWYPQGKVVFMAPTKPLVAQQIEACFNIMGIPESDMAEMTGSMAPSERKKTWKTKRVFFLTPQVLSNDLSRQACPAEDIKCLVVDEAHKALGNHAYCEVVRELAKYTPNFRVLALSATPGGDLKAVQQVLNNLLISHVEIRSEESIDIQPFTHERKVEKVVVPLGEELKHIQNKYLEMLRLYINRLSRAGAIFNKDPASLSKFQLLKAREAFRQDPPPQVQSKGAVEGDFAISLSLYHGYELLMQHGTRTLYHFLSNTVDGDKGFSRTRQELMRNGDFINIMNILKEKFDYDGNTSLSGTIGGSSSTSPSSRQISCTQKSKKFVVSHPKMQKLQEVVLQHFKNFQSGAENKPSTSVSGATMETRVMIFAQYRDSVQEIAEMLNCHQPLVRCMSFVGQSSAGKATKGISQKEQLRVVKEFRCGNYNTLVSTCVGEEGLDIGDVDLIVCYDAHKSPTRLVQRMGRTGRKRKGRIVMLMTEGKEASVYDKSQYSRRGIHKALQGNSKSLQLYPSCPRMIPRGLNPQPHKMHITVEQYEGKKKNKKGGRRTTEGPITSIVQKWQEKLPKESWFLNENEYSEWVNRYRIPDQNVPTLPQGGSIRCLGEPRKAAANSLSLSSWSLWQSKEQSTHKVHHSQRCKDFVHLMEFMEIQDQIDGDDIYGMEMALHLNEDDVIKSQTGKGIEKFCRKKQEKVKRVGEEVTERLHSQSEEDQENQMNKIRRKKKRVSLPLLVSDESDDDFLDKSGTTLPDVRLDKKILRKHGRLAEDRSPSTKEEVIRFGSVEEPGEVGSIKEERLNTPVEENVRDNKVDVAVRKGEEGLSSEKTETVRENLNMSENVLDLPGRSTIDEVTECVKDEKQEAGGTGQIGDEKEREDINTASKLKVVTKPKHQSNPKKRGQIVLIVDSPDEADFEGNSSRSAKKLCRNEKSPTHVDAVVTLLKSCKERQKRDSQEREPEPDEKADRSNNEIDLLEEDAEQDKPIGSVPDETDINKQHSKLSKEMEEDLSSFFPCSQFSFVQNTSTAATARKSFAFHLPPSPPSVSSLDILDDIGLHFGTPGCEAGLSLGHRDGKEPEEGEVTQEELSSSKIVQEIPQQGHLKKVDCSPHQRDKVCKKGSSDEGSILVSEDINLQENRTKQFDKDFIPVPRCDRSRETEEGRSSAVHSVPPSDQKITESLCLDDLQGFYEEDWEDSNVAPLPVEVQTPTFSASKAEFGKCQEKSSASGSLVRDEIGNPTHPSTPIIKKVGFSLCPTKQPFNFQSVSELSRDSENRITVESKALGNNSENRPKNSSIITDVTLPSDERFVSSSSGVKNDSCNLECDIGMNFDLNFDLDSLDDDDGDPSLLLTSPPGVSSHHPVSLHLPKAESTPLNRFDSCRRQWNSPDVTPVIQMQAKKRIERSKPSSGLEMSAESETKDNLERDGETQAREDTLWGGTRMDTLQSVPEGPHSNNTLKSSLLRKLSFCNRSEISEPEERDASKRGEELTDSTKKKSVPMEMIQRKSGSDVSEECLKIKPSTESSTSVGSDDKTDTQEFKIGQSALSDSVKEGESEVVLVVDEDEDEPLSQIPKPKKRRQNALRSPDEQSPVSNARKLKEKRRNPRKILQSSSEEESLMSPPRKKPRQKRFLLSSSVSLMEDDDDADFEDPSPPRYRTSPSNSRLTTHKLANKKRAHKNKGRREANAFLDQEAAVSDDGKGSSDEEGSVLDQSLEGFINDATQMSEDMHAMYMKSVRSPAGNRVLHPGRNRFKMSHKGPINDNIFSQAPQQDETYTEDSFVVEGEGDVTEVENVTADSRRCDLEDTINVDNIIGGTSCKRLRNRRGGESKAERILRLGRKAVLKSDSTEEDSESDVESNMVMPQKRNEYSRGKGQRSSSVSSKASSVRKSDRGQETRQVKSGSNLNSRNEQNRAKVGNKNVGKPVRNFREGVNGSRETMLNSHTVDMDLNFDLNFVDDLLAESHFPSNNKPLNNFTKEQTSTLTKEQLEKEERLRKQKEKQEEFRKKMAAKRKSPADMAVMQCNSRTSQEGTKSQGFDVSTENREKRTDVTDIPLHPSQRMNLTNNSSLTSNLNSDKPVILISSRELASSSSIVSTLAIKHGTDPRVCQLRGCDYMVSNRMGVEKQTMSEFSSSSNKMKLVEKFKEMKMRFDKLCIIIEKDRLKREEKPRAIIRTKYFDSTLAALAKAPMKMLFSDSTDETALILAELARVESRKGFAIVYPKELTEIQEQVLGFCLSLPSVNYASALSMTLNFSSLSELITCSEEYFKERTGIYGDRVKSIMGHFKHCFDEQMMRTPKR